MSYTVDDGCNVYTVNYNVPNVKKKVLRRHKRVMQHIRRTWDEIRKIIQFYIKHGMGTNCLMQKYVRLFINQSRIKV